MLTPILVPKLGMTQANVTVVKWNKTDGEPVEKGTPVVVIETAKVSYEVEAPASGLVFVLRRVKERVNVGDALGMIADGEEEFQEYKKGLKEKPVPPAEGLFEEPQEEWGIRLSFEGAGEEEKEAPPAPQPAPELGDRSVLERVPFIGMRRTIAENLVSSLQQGAQLTVVSETDMTELARFRNELLLDRPDQRITFVDMLVKLLAFTLKEFPLLNSTIVGDEIICWGEYHIGVAVALESGLVVPVVRNADRKGLFAVSREIKKLAARPAPMNSPPTITRGVPSPSAAGETWMWIS